MDAAQFPPHQARKTDDWETWKLPGASKEGNFSRQWREDIAKTDLENLWFLCCGAGEDQGDARSAGPNTAIRIFREQQCEQTNFFYPMYIDIPNDFESDGDFDSFKLSVQEALRDPPAQPEIFVLSVSPTSEAVREKHPANIEVFCSVSSSRILLMMQ